jgi:hypothetical protein
MATYVEPKKYKAVTVKEITGQRIVTVPIGTEFLVSNIDNDVYANAFGIGVTSVFHDEYKLLD